ncbi:MAG: helix-turn-helix domain-containing protein [Actinomycetota bacterium]
MVTSPISTVQPAPLLSARETARRLGVSVTSVHRLRVAGRLPGIRLHPTAPLRFEPEAVAALIAHGREAA